MALCKFGHFSLVSKISHILLELEPHNLINRLVVMRRRGLLLLGMNVLCIFGHFSLVGKRSQKLLELEPHNLMNRLVVMRR